MAIPVGYSSPSLPRFIKSTCPPYQPEDTVDRLSFLKKKIELGCLSNFVAGKLSIAVTGGATMTLDYDPIGGEPCDKIAQVTVNGESRNIVLR